MQVWQIPDFSCFIYESHIRGVHRCPFHSEAVGKLFWEDVCCLLLRWSWMEHDAQDAEHDVWGLRGWWRPRAGIFVLYLWVVQAGKPSLAGLLGALGVPSCAEPPAEATILHNFWNVSSFSIPPSAPSSLFLHSQRGNLLLCLSALLVEICYISPRGLAYGEACHYFGVQTRFCHLITNSSYCCGNPSHQGTFAFSRAAGRGGRRLLCSCPHQKI